jgi:putative MATE family efflux protein
LKTQHSTIEESLLDSPHEQDLTRGNIRAQLWSLAWPMMLSVFFYTLYNIVDAYWVSKLSPESIAAVSISQITLFLMISLGFGITMGSGVIMSMDIGAKNKPEAERVLGQSFVLTAIAGVFFTIVSLFFREQLLTVSGAEGAIFEPALSYFTVTAGGSLLFFILVTIMFAFNAQGDTFTLTKLFALSTLVNVILDPILIFGWLGMPAMGIAGAAISTVVSQAVFIVIALRSLSSPKRSIQFHFRNLSFRWVSVKQVLKIGIPAALTQIINPIGLAALTLISSRAFQEPGAIAFSLGFRIEFFAYLPAVGYGFGAMAMIGQNIGARNLDRAKQVLRMALTYGAGFAFFMGILAALFAPQIIRIFTDDPTVTSYSLLYFRTVALSYGFLAAMMIEANAFQAIGKSWPGFWILFLRFIVISIPLSYVLTLVLDFPIVAVWGALVLGNVIASVVGYLWIWFTINRFDLKEVVETVQMHG